MPIEQHTFNAVVRLDLNTTIELLETVISATMLNAKLNNNQELKIIASTTMLNYAIKMLEQCGCSIDISINNPRWINATRYNTNGDSLGNIR